MAGVEPIERDTDHPIQGLALLVEQVARQLSAVAPARVGTEWCEEDRGPHIGAWSSLGDRLVPGCSWLHDRDVH